MRPRTAHAWRLRPFGNVLWLYLGAQDVCMLCSALLKLPRWVASGGRDFVFYHSYPGLSMGSAQADATFASVVCNNFQWATMLAAEQVLFDTTIPVSHQGISKS